MRKIEFAVKQATNSKHYRDTLKSIDFDEPLEVRNLYQSLKAEQLDEAQGIFLGLNVIRDRCFIVKITPALRDNQKRAMLYRVMLNLPAGEITQDNIEGLLDEGTLREHTEITHTVDGCDTARPITISTETAKGTRLLRSHLKISTDNYSELQRQILRLYPFLKDGSHITITATATSNDIDSAFKRTAIAIEDFATQVSEIINGSHRTSASDESHLSEGQEKDSITEKSPPDHDKLPQIQSQPDATETPAEMCSSTMDPANVSNPSTEEIMYDGPHKGDQKEELEEPPEAEPSTGQEQTLRGQKDQEHERDPDETGSSDDVDLSKPEGVTPDVRTEATDSVSLAEKYEKDSPPSRLQQAMESKLSPTSPPSSTFLWKYRKSISEELEERTKAKTWMGGRSNQDEIAQQRLIATSVEALRKKLVTNREADPGITSRLKFLELAALFHQFELQIESEGSFVEAVCFHCESDPRGEWSILVDDVRWFIESLPQNTPVKKFFTDFASLTGEVLTRLAISKS